MRVKGSTPTRNRRKKVLKLAKGYFGSKHLLYRTANEQVMRSLRYSYIGRKQTKREMRKLGLLVLTQQLDSMIYHIPSSCMV